MSVLGEFYNKNGYTPPIRAISEDDAKVIEVELRETLAKQNFESLARRNRHFDIESVKQLLTNDKLLAAVREISSNDFVLWRSHIFTGRAGRGLGWHRDYFRTLLANPLDHCTLHFGVTATKQNNKLMVVPCSHKLPVGDLAEFGFELIRKTQDTGYGTPYYIRRDPNVEIVEIDLKAGEFFIFHAGTLHASVNRIGDTSNRSSVKLWAKSTAKFVLSRFAAHGIGTIGSRVGIGFRFCSLSNNVNEVAYAETKHKGHMPVLLGSGQNRCPPGLADWRINNGSESRI